MKTPATPQRPTQTEPARRKARLAAALKANIARRKAQAEARAADLAGGGDPQAKKDGQG